MKRVFRLAGNLLVMCSVSACTLLDTSAYTYKDFKTVFFKTSYKKPLVKANIPRGYTKDGTISPHHHEYMYIYPDSSLFYMTNREFYLKAQSGLSSRYENSRLCKEVNNLFCREIKLESVYIGYLNADAKDTIKFNNAIKSAVLLKK